MHHLTNGSRVKEMAAKQRLDWHWWEPAVCHALHALSKRSKSSCVLRTCNCLPSLQLLNCRLGISERKTTTALRLQQSESSYLNSSWALKGFLSAQASAGAPDDNLLCKGSEDKPSTLLSTHPAPLVMCVHSQALNSHASQVHECLFSSHCRAFCSLAALSIPLYALLSSSL